MLMLSDYYLTLYSNRSRLDAYSNHVVLEVYELNPIFMSDIESNKLFNIKHLFGVLLVSLLLFWAHYRWDGSYIFKLGYGILIYGFTLINANHLLNIFIFRFVRNNPEEIKGQITQSAKYVYTVSAGQDIAFTIAIAPLAILTGSIYLYGALLAGVSMAVTHIAWYRAFKKNKEISTNSDTNRRKSGRLLKKLKLCFLILLIVIFIGNEGYQIYLNKTFTKEEIDAAFEPITSKYGIKIVYEIGDDFFSPNVAAGP